VGPEVDVAVLKVNGETTAVGLTQPKDEKKFDQQLEAAKQPLVHEKISGWTAFCDKQAPLDAVAKHVGSLSDQQAYKDATGTLPGAGDALAEAYVAPTALAEAVTSITKAASTVAPSGTAAQLGKIKWIAGAATAHDDGVEVDVHLKSSSRVTGNAFSKSPADVIPSGALVAVAFNGGGSSTLASKASQDALAQLNGLLGIDLRTLLTALSGETLLYARPGAPIPEVTLLASGGDPKQAAASVGALIRRFAHASSAPAPANVDGVPLERAALGPVDLYYGVFDGKLLVTDSARAVPELRSNGDKLSDDSIFKAAKDAAGMPDSTPGFVYVNLRDALPTIEGLAALANARIPPQVDANLQPLKSFLAYASSGGGVENIVAFLQTGS
jgi:hypothetical protein